MAAELDEQVPDGSEQLDQLQADDSLIDRGVADVLDEGYIAPDHWSCAEGFGNTAAEMRQGESLEMRMAQEEPDGGWTYADTDDWNPSHEKRQVGTKRAGRLVAHGHGYDVEDDEAESTAEDMGYSGGAASAEEAAMHIIEDPDDIDDQSTGN